MQRDGIGREKRSTTFLEKLGAVIVYRKNTKKYQNQRGQISIQTGQEKGADRGQIRLINTSRLQGERHRRRTDWEQKRNRSGFTIKDPNTNPNPNDILSGKKPDTIPYQKIINYLNNETSSAFRHTNQETKNYIKARWNEGHREEDFRAVVDVKKAEWINDSQMSVYLRPETLFGHRFESYLMQAQKADGGVNRLLDDAKSVLKYDGEDACRSFLQKKGRMDPNTIENWIRQNKGLKHEI